MNNRLFVGNLAFDVIQEDLSDAFAQYGTVVEINLMKDRATGKSRGFAFVTMADDEEAKAAIHALNGQELNGRVLTVNIAKPREDRGGGDRGGGGGRGRR